jgi:fatty acid desaturase
MDCRRISHRTHHQNHGHVEKDESWHPVAICSVALSLCRFMVNYAGGA